MNSLTMDMIQAWPTEVNSSVARVNASQLESPSPGVVELPANLRFSLADSVVDLATYGFLFIIAAIGNVTTLFSLLRSRHRQSRVSLLLTHLVIADLLVTFIMIPMELAWRVTVQWVAGNAACKLFLFLRAFGLYLSSNVLVCVSLDRYFAVVYPLRVTDARKRGKCMLTAAWLVSFCSAVPQSVVFHVERHPDFSDFKQCVSFNYFSTPAKETTYNIFCVLAMYFVPLCLISFAYLRIFIEITRKSCDNATEPTTAAANGDCCKMAAPPVTPQLVANLRQQTTRRMQLRRSDPTQIERARTKTLRMSLTIVAVFFWCWTPYVFMTVWYMVDRSSASQFNPRLQDFFFVMAVSNSCMNPLVYGSYNRKECSRFLCFSASEKRLGRRSPVIGSGLNNNTRLTGLNERNRTNQNFDTRIDIQPHSRARSTISMQDLTNQQNPKVVGGTRRARGDYHSDPGDQRLPPPDAIVSID
ncbi:gonadotropin-releasing hormone II receptor isoform X2 [Nilaparvata lugens]|uniref:gonadotropin-releasing hormone II receptor isoform X2 n=1 Tax=Nilaparvata lugens TaxID=108931 RepID=UPI00193D1D74|nr:gonadotropin-releasing hormone II receptor isoform X2 [Nilaparvata lugens]